MNRHAFHQRLLCTAILWAASAAPLPSAAASSAASSASDGASASVGSASASLTASSNGSSRATRTARGDYTITEIASVDDRAGFARLTLTPVASTAPGVDANALDANTKTNTDTNTNPNIAESLYLVLPQAALDQHALASGSVVSAQPAPYGVAFARRDTHERFFLVLDDAWHRELASHPVAL